MSQRTSVVLVIASLSVVSAVPGPAQAQCTPEWAADYSVTSYGPSSITATVTFDDGSGPALYAASSVGSVWKFDGKSWITIGGTFYANTSGAAQGYVYALCVYDSDGAGPAAPNLYAAGQFRRVGSPVQATIVTAQNVARWNGTQWVAVGGGWAGTMAYALETFDSGSGAQLYIGGQGAAASLQRFNTSTNTWQTPTPTPNFGSGSNWISALKSFNDGSGPALFVASTYSGAAGVTSPYIIKYTGTAWQAVGAGLNATPSSVAVFDAGSGANLYIAGSFTPAHDDIVRWNGAAFANTGSGLPAIYTGLSLKTLTVGTQTALYLAGAFDSIGSATDVNGLARYDGTAWTGCGHPSRSTNGAYRVDAFDFDGAGPELPLLVVYDAGVGGLAKEDGAGSVSIVPATTPANIERGLLRVLDLDGAGPQTARLYSFSNEVPYLKYSYDPVQTPVINKAAVFDGTTWSEFGGGLSDWFSATVFDALVFDDGTGPALYVGGSFALVEGDPVVGVLRWTGTTWAPVDLAPPGGVNALTIFDDGTGPQLYVAGGFDTAGGNPAAKAAKWNGALWTPLGDGSGPDGAINAVQVYDDGTGPALFVAGSFATVAGNPAANIAKWDGTQWSALGDGVNNVVLALATLDDGAGERLYAGGQFTTAGGISTNYVAAWNGTGWAALGGGIANRSGVATFGVYSMTTFDDGSGLALYVGGGFALAEGQNAYSIARWNGTSWGTLNGGLRVFREPWNGKVSSLAAWNSALYASGSFSMAGSAQIQSTGFAKWGCAAPAVCHGDCDCDGNVGFNDIDYFVVAIPDQQATWAALYAARHGGTQPPCTFANCDLDGDGHVGFPDIDPFVISIPSACP